MKLRLVAAAFALSLTICGSAVAAGSQASRTSLAAQVKHSTDVVQFFTVGQGAWMPARRHRSCADVAWRATCVRARAIVVLHRRLLAGAQRRLAELEQPSHYAGWSCITNGAYPGAAHEGNGYNGSYSGPLGMTTPWLGHSPPGSDWVHSDRSAVYAIAERVAAAQHFSYAFMRGQWPNTYPPCARFFR